jgi:hypothetical protein
MDAIADLQLELSAKSLVNPQKMAVAGGKGGAPKLPTIHGADHRHLTPSSQVIRGVRWEFYAYPASEANDQMCVETESLPHSAWRFLFAYYWPIAHGLARKGDQPCSKIGRTSIAPWLAAGILAP